MIKQYYEKKLCLCCEVFKHFRSNCLYYSAQQLTISIIIVNIIFTVLEFMIHKSNVREIYDLKKKNSL